MTPSERRTDRKRWEDLAADPERALRTLFIAATLAVAIAVGLNLFVKCVAWNFLDALKAFAILLGICGAVYQFVLRRAFESALIIGVTVQAHAYDSARYATHLEVRLKNIGNRRIAATPALSEDEIKEYEDSILYPGDLSIRRLREKALPESERGAAKTIPTQFANWWLDPLAGDSAAAASQSAFGLEQVCEPASLLDEYSTADSKIEFFMEPGEEYYFSNLIVLPPGHYLAKVVFVGDRAGAAEYWSRIAYFCVPNSAPVQSSPDEGTINALS